MSPAIELAEHRRRRVVGLRRRFISVVQRNVHATRMHNSSVPEHTLIDRMAFAVIAVATFTASSIAPLACHEYAVGCIVMRGICGSPHRGL